MEKDHFWFVARRQLVAWLIETASAQKIDRLVDLGCGPGQALREWTGYADEVVGVDIHEAKDPAPTRAITRIRADAAATGLENESADVVLALDLIEHTDDTAVLAECARILRPGGKLIVSVPAYQWLWGPRDAEAGHLRRYSKAMLRDRIEEAGLKLERAIGYQFFLFPLVAASRLLSFRTKTGLRNTEDNPPRWANALLSGINRMEVALGKMGVRFPVGSSFFVVAAR